MTYDHLMANIGTYSNALNAAGEEIEMSRCNKDWQLIAIDHIFITTVQYSTVVFGTMCRVECCGLKSILGGFLCSPRSAGADTL